MRLRLLQDLHQGSSVGELVLRGLIEIGGKLGEDLHLPILRKVNPQGTAGLLHCLLLCGAADTGDRKPDIDRRPLTCKKQVTFKKDLTICDGDYVGRNIGRHISVLRLYDRKRRDGSAAQCIGEVTGALQETAVEIENIAWISLTSRTSAEEQGKCPICHRVLGKIVIDNQHILSAVHEILRQGSCRIRGDILQRCGFSSCGAADGGICHSPRLRQGLDKMRHRGCLLSDRTINADAVLTLLIDDRIHCDAGLARLPVSDN